MSGKRGGLQPGGFGYALQRPAAFKRILGLAVALLLAAGITGCNAGNNTAGGKYKAQAYPQDGYMGLTSVNPNNPLHPTYHHYRDDADLMKAVLAQLKGIDKTSITFNGPTAKVKIKPKKELTEAQAEELRSQAQMALDTNMPRYDVRVTVER